MVNINIIIKYFITLLIISIYLYISSISIYGIDSNEIENIYLNNKFNEIKYIDIYFGGLLSKMSVLGINIIPYLIVNLIINLGSNFNNFLYKIKINSSNIFGKIYIYFFTFIICICQSIILSVYFFKNCQNNGLNKIIIFPFYKFIFSTVLILTLGTFIVIILSKIIDKYGIGLGILNIIIVNISWSNINKVYKFYYTTNILSSLITILLIYGCILVLINKIQKSYNTIIIPNYNSDYTLFIKPTFYNNNYIKIKNYIFIPFEIVGILPVLSIELYTKILDSKYFQMILLNDTYKILILYNFIIYFFIFLIIYIIIIIYTIKNFEIIKNTIYFENNGIFSLIRNKKELINLFKFIIVNNYLYLILITYIIFYLPNYITNNTNLEYIIEPMEIVSLWILNKIIYIVINKI